MKLVLVFPLSSIPFPTNSQTFRNQAAMSDLRTPKAEAELTLVTKDIKHIALDTDTAFQFVDHAAASAGTPLGAFRDLNKTLEQEVLVPLEINAFQRFLPNVIGQNYLACFVRARCLNAFETLC